MAADGRHHTLPECCLHDHSSQRHDYATMAGRSAVDEWLVAPTRRMVVLVSWQKRRPRIAPMNSGMIVHGCEGAAAAAVEVFALTAAAAADVGEWAGLVAGNAALTLVAAVVIVEE